eukprot:jgi/Psemu1/303901/fgenesh1_kg.128_\
MKECIPEIFMLIWMSMFPTNCLAIGFDWGQGIDDTPPSTGSDGVGIGIGAGIGVKEGVIERAAGTRCWNVVVETRSVIYARNLSSRWNVSEWIMCLMSRL